MEYPQPFSLETPLPRRITPIPPGRARSAAADRAGWLKHQPPRAAFRPDARDDIARAVSGISLLSCRSALSHELVDATLLG
jgi:hypothetical protein